jgi:hypothetical protein
MSRLEKKIVTNMDEVEMLAGRYDVLNRQAVSGMRKAKDMRPRVVYAGMFQACASRQYSWVSKS